MLQTNATYIIECEASATRSSSNTCATSIRAKRFEDSLRDVSARLASIESYLATVHGDVARHGGEIEALKARIDRIERRLDIVGRE